MNKRIFIKTGIILLTTLIVVLFAIRFYKSDISTISSSLEPSTAKDNTISIMYTDDKGVSTYGLYDILSKTFQEIYSRENIDYSDFFINKKHNSLYYSQVINDKYNIFKVDLNSKNEISLFDNIEFSGDRFSISNDIMVTKTLTKDSERSVLGKYNLSTKEFQKFDNFDSDSELVNFYVNENSNLIYTIEHSLKEAKESRLRPSTHSIYKYDIDGKSREFIYSDKNDINNISVNKKDNKLLFDGYTMESVGYTNKIYLLDLKSKTSEVLMEPNTIINGIKFDYIKNPKFSPNNEGFYFLAVTENSNVINKNQGENTIKSNGIYYYDFNSKNVELIYDNKTSIINDYKITLH